MAGDYLAARHAQATQDTAVATDLYTRALADDPNNPELLRRTFQLMASNGRIDDALPIARRIIADTPSAALPALTLIAEDVRARRYNEALERASALPNDGLVAFVRPLAVGWAQAGLGNKAAAEKAVKELGAKNGFELFADFHIALIDDLMGDQGGARSAFTAAAAANRAQFVRVTEGAGAFFERAGDRDTAQRLYQTYEQVHGDTLIMKPALARIAAGGTTPRLVSNIDEGLAESFFDIASLLHQERIDDVAIILAQLSLRLHPDFSMAKLLIADVYEAEGHLESAIAVYESIDPTAPVSWSARLRTAALLADVDQFDAATLRLEAMAEERPERSDALVELGDVLRSAERFPEAVAAYDQALARVPHIEERNWSIFYSRGIALERSNQWPKAEADFLKAIELSPNQAYTLNYLAYSWVERGIHLERAQAMLERAMQLRPKDPQIIDSMGWVLYHLGRFDGAVNNLEQAVELRPQDAVINDHLGDAYWRVGRRNEARFQWQRALNLDPEPDLSTNLAEKIQHGLKPFTGGRSAGATPITAKSTTGRGS
jgi:tetratricopeptide (TPR) repeat protein